jgi:hypothetical protein
MSLKVDQVSSSNRRRSIANNASIGEVVDNKDSIKVLCRFRPANKLSQESKRGNNQNDKADCFQVDSDKAEIEYLNEFGDTKVFKYDKVIRSCFS